MILPQCEDTEGRRPYYPPHRDIHPHDVIYAQPVTIKPVGRPLPAIPVKRPYGPAKPVPLLPSFGSSFPGPVYPGPPTFNRPPPSFVEPYPGYKKTGLPPFVSKPIYETGVDVGLDYEDKLIDKKQVVLHQSGSGVQQHVHHHYHHGDAAVAGGLTSGVAPPVVIPSSSLGGGAGNGLGSYGYGSGGTYGSSYNDFEDYKKTFKIKTTPNSGPSVFSSDKSYADRYPVYEKPHGKQFVANGLQQFGGSSGNNQFLTNDGSSGNNQFLTNDGSGGFDYQYDSGSLNYEDCVCVPYEQCSANNHAGRKDDLYLAIDPRNLDKDIEAESVEVVITDGNGTMSVVRIPKGANETELVQQTKNERTVEVAKRSRRDVKQITKKDDKKQQAEEVS